MRYLLLLVSDQKVALVWMRRQLEETQAELVGTLESLDVEMDERLGGGLGGRPGRDERGRESPFDRKSLVFEGRESWGCREECEECGIGMEFEGHEGDDGARLKWIGEGGEGGWGGTWESGLVRRVQKWE
jgi:hypothetical protein